MGLGGTTLENPKGTSVRSLSKRPNLITRRFGTLITVVKVECF